MMSTRISPWIVIGVMLSVSSVGALAQQTVYKWVDKDGIVHFSDTKPPESASVETSTVSISPSPAQPATVATARAAPSASEEPAEAATVTPPNPAAQPKPAAARIEDMGLPELDQRCDAAREAEIAPLRAAEIKICQQDKRTDPDWCVRFNASFGEGGRNINGSMRPRMFDDLPECVDALQERNRRGR